MQEAPLKYKVSFCFLFVVVVVLFVCFQVLFRQKYMRKYTEKTKEKLLLVLGPCRRRPLRAVQLRFLKSLHLLELRLHVRGEEFA